MHLNFSKKDMRGCKWKSVLWGGLCCPRGRQVHAKGAFRTGTGDPTWCRERAPSGRAASPTRVRVPRAPAPGAAPPARRRSAARTWAPAAPSLHAEQAVGSREVRDTSLLRQARSAAFAQIRAYKLVRPPLQKCEYPKWSLFIIAAAISRSFQCYPQPWSPHKLTAEPQGSRVTVAPAPLPAFPWITPPFSGR